MRQVILLTDKPAAVATLFVDRGLAKQDAELGIIPAIKGLSWRKVPNPIADDTRACFLVTLAKDAFTTDKTDDGDPETKVDYMPSKLMKAVRDKGTKATERTADGKEVTRWRLTAKSANIDLVFGTGREHFGQMQ